jgi:hypothetical protein
VTADKLARLDVTLELTGKIITSFFFSLTATVGKEDVRYLNAIFVIAVENLHRLKGLRNGPSTADKNTVDVKGKDKGVGHRLRNSRGERRGGGSETGNAVTGARASELRRARDRVRSGDLAVVREVVLEELGLL